MAPQSGGAPTSVVATARELANLLGWREHEENATISHALEVPPSPANTSEVWQSWTKLSLPPRHRTFIQMAFWHKPLVGWRLSNWLPHNTHRAIDGKPEDMPHAMCGGCFLPPAFSVATQCMARLQVEDTTESDPLVLLWDLPAPLLQIAAGPVFWTAVMTSCNVCNRTKHRDIPHGIFSCCNGWSTRKAV